jgi:hypothetical protein
VPGCDQKLKAHAVGLFAIDKAKGFFGRQEGLAVSWQELFKLGLC